MTMALGGSLCFDSTPHAATSWGSAWLDCANSARRLPSTGDLGIVYLTIIGSTETNWSDDATSASSHYAFSLTGNVVGFEDHPDSDSVGFRCVVTPHNNLGPAPTGPAARQGTAAKSSIRKARHLRSRTRHK
jgi:hypothetical protein